MTRPEPGAFDHRVEAQTEGPRHVRWIVWRPVRRSALIGVHVIEATMRVTVWGTIAKPAYPLIVGGLTLLLTMSMTIPAASIVIGAVLLRRDRWTELVLAASLGSAIGGLVLYLAFHHLGWNQIAAAYPDLVRSQAWADATRWVAAYGTWALFAIAALPLPQTPALVFTAVSRLTAQDVFLALFLGKLVKYGVYGFVAARFPSWFQHAVAEAPHKP
jgi:membrane protein YqaA with SNARE-associated domain